MTVALILGTLALLLAIGTPVGFAMLFAGTLGILDYGGFDAVIGVLQTSPLTIAGTYEFITIPLFLLMAEFILQSGIADDLFRATAAWVGRVRGGLGMATARWPAPVSARSAAPARHRPLPCRPPACRR